MKTLLILLLLGQYPEHSLVPIKENADDIAIMRVAGTEIEFMEYMALADGGWVFTGPPGNYKVRLFNCESKETIIKDIVIGSDPGPGPGPGPDPDNFDNLKSNIKNWSKNLPENFPRSELSKLYISVADRLEGLKQPIIPTISVAINEVAEGQLLILKGHETNWEPVRQKIAVVWDKYKTSFDRQSAALFLRLVGQGISEQ